MVNFILDNGHGSDTKGKRSPSSPPGIMEYEFNRYIVQRIMYLSLYEEFNCICLVPEIKSVKLVDRVERIREISERIENCFIVSIHANAMGSGAVWKNSAHGSCVFVHPRSEEKTKQFAKILADKISELGKMRNRGVKEKKMYILGKPLKFGVQGLLSENGFMTCYEEARKLATTYWREKIAIAHIEAFREINKELQNGRY